ncbi:hypothetical protein HYALB_00007247 [Hymenoscyphus albidus]|uniref:Uncharacterized protein n=1 Tax=Hymenoscyphus albidus TaxID=595503 RepID=A0A9N9LAT3_9HELO|nr:hypothetical protein HYALB_00007247 [Hymenoscyphus albidus]
MSDITSSHIESFFHLFSTYIFYIEVLNQVEGTGLDSIHDDPRDEYFDIVRKHPGYVDFAKYWDVNLAPWIPTIITESRPRLEWFHWEFVKYYVSGFKQREDQEFKLDNRILALKCIRSKKALFKEVPPGLQYRDCYYELVDITRLLAIRMSFDEKLLVIEEALNRIKGQNEEEKEAAFATFKETNYGSAFK